MIMHMHMATRHLGTRAHDCTSWNQEMRVNTFWKEGAQVVCGCELLTSMLSYRSCSGEVYDGEWFEGLPSGKVCGL
jgi:hypothetical protein